MLQDVSHENTYLHGFQGLTSGGGGCRFALFPARPYSVRAIIFVGTSFNLIAGVSRIGLDVEWITYNATVSA